MMPFSHVPGAACLIPGTAWEIEAFPTLLRMQRGKIEVPLKITGPVLGFTLQQDLERNCVWVFGQAVEGHFRLRVTGSREGLEIFGDRLPDGGIACGDKVLERKKSLLFPMEIEWHLPEKIERLSLGSHKAQDWDLVWRRFDLREILPVLYLLGQKVPPATCKGGTARLLEFPEKLELFCRAGFSKILIPRLKDEQHQGLCPEEPVEGSRYALLPEAFLRMRALFFEEQQRGVCLLPKNPFEAGRLIGIRAAGIGTWDLEWSKWVLRRAIFHAERTGELRIELSKGLKSFRMRTSEREKGKRWEKKVVVEEGKSYLLDRFQS